MGILQSDLDEAKCTWNTHRVRKTQGAECPGGRTDVLFFTPENSGGENCSYPVTEADLSIMPEFTRSPKLFGCSDEFYQFVT